MPQVVTQEEFQALKAELGEMRKKLSQREKGEWVAMGALEEVPKIPTKAELSATERKKLLKEYPEDTRCVWQGASLGKEERARMSKETRAEEGDLFNFQGEILEALRPLLDVLDINFNEGRRNRLIEEGVVLEQVCTAVLSSYKLLAGTATEMELKRKELALTAISPKLASLVKPADANPLITKEDRERMEEIHKEELMMKKMSGEAGGARGSSQPFRGSGQREGNAGRGNFPQAWKPYRGGGQSGFNRGRGRGAPQHGQQQQQQQQYQQRSNQPAFQAPTGN